MSNRPPLSPRDDPGKGPRILLMAVTLAFVAVIVPFYGALMWAAILALLFQPLQGVFLRRLRGRSGWAAVATLTVVTLIVILPLMGVTFALVRQATRLAQEIESRQIDVVVVLDRVLSALPASVMSMMQHFDLADTASIQQRIEESAGRVGQYLAGQVLDIGQGTINFLVSLCVAIYVAFFMLRNGSEMSQKFWESVPLPATEKAEIKDRLVGVVRATVKGSFIVALVQGTLGGIALALLGISGALLWGALMAALSLLPAVGAALVWLPVALYLLLTGAIWQGVTLTVFGVFVIGLVDNLLRPSLVGREAQLPDWLVLVSTIGGIAVLGFNGFVLGPVVASMFVTAWALFGARRREAPSR